MKKQYNNNKNNKNISSSLPLELLFEIFRAANTRDEKTTIFNSDISIMKINFKKYAIKLMSSSTIIYVYAGKFFKNLHRKINKKKMSTCKFCSVSLNEENFNNNELFVCNGCISIILNPPEVPTEPLVVPQIFQEAPVTKSLFIYSEGGGYLHKQTREVMTLDELSSQGLDLGSDDIEVVTDIGVSLHNAIKIGLIREDIKKILNTKYGINHPESKKELTLNETILFGLYDPSTRQFRDYETNELLLPYDPRHFCSTEIQNMLIRSGILALPPMELNQTLINDLLNTQPFQVDPKSDQSTSRDALEDSNKSGERFILSEALDHQRPIDDNLCELSHAYKSNLHSTPAAQKDEYTCKTPFTSPTVLEVEQPFVRDFSQFEEFKENFIYADIAIGLDITYHKNEEEKGEDYYKNYITKKVEEWIQEGETNSTICIPNVINENGKEGVVINELTTIDQFKCLKEKLSIKFVIVRAGNSNGYIDNNAVENIKNARAAGIEDVDIYIPPSVSCNQPSENVIRILSHLNVNNTKFGNVWLSVHGLVNGTNYAGWKNDKVKNVEFINEMVNTLINNNQNYGIYTNKYDWHEITGNTQIFNNVSLLYEHYDNENNFEDYNEYGYPFGDWDKPTMKVYSNKEVCGVNVTRVWRP